jgi:hypothetical protein
MAFELGAVLYSHSPRYPEGRGRRITRAQEFKISLGKIVRPCIPITQ